MGSDELLTHTATAETSVADWEKNTARVSPKEVSDEIVRLVQLHAV